ncbi:hypothetical protein CHS0354_022175 [Potamilus streckersoni]|uniref:BRISC and BRCA1-A complex member 1 n=1 Tax=Potamilus streckersoni TaxID=2493646 RepID=A0AAE0VJJ0_9BIVA|nr:hypothetical protein CHS0354_022175 [Potamilus streckersoni]
MADIDEEMTIMQSSDGVPDNAAMIASSVIHEYDVIDTEDVIKCSETNTTHFKSDNDDKIQIRSIPIPLNSTAELEERRSEREERRSEREEYSRNRLSSSERSNSIQEDYIPEITCPRVNCPEKIVICIDLSKEMDRLSLRSRSGDKLSPMMIITRALHLFVYSKIQCDKRHEFAVVLLQESAVWIKDFTSNPKDIINCLDDLSATYTCETFDVDSLFDLIRERVPMPHVDGDQAVLPPPYIVRLIFLFGRSDTSMKVESKENLNMLYSSPYFFLDAIYIHEPPSAENKCQENFDKICDFDSKGLSFILSVCRNITKIYDHMAQCLAHPLQRPIQKNVFYRLGPPMSDEG